MRGRRLVAGGLPLFAAWLALVGTGFWLLAEYKGRPGFADDAPPHQPSGGPADGGFTLLLFAHPRCPCTRATLAELERVMAKSGGRLTARVLFFRPRAAERPWRETDLWGQAVGIPGVTAAWDDGGEEAARYGARTSGHAVLYDAEGRLRFRGGLTGSRGHEGDNAGRLAVVALVNGERGGTAEVPVFGCPLSTADEPTREGLRP